MEEFARRFTESLSREAACCLISSTQVDTVLGNVGIAQAVGGSPEDFRLHAWLNQQELLFRHMVYVADPGLTNWTKRCIRQADEFISLGVPTGVPNLTEVEAEILRQEVSRSAKPRKTLILLHPPGTNKPRDTMCWLDNRSVDRHHHIRSGNQGDLDRVVRYVSRLEIGLVLSGGGFRGFAHAGILRAIREAGLPIDVLGVCVSEPLKGICVGRAS